MIPCESYRLREGPAFVKGTLAIKYRGRQDVTRHSTGLFFEDDEDVVDDGGDGVSEIVSSRMDTATLVRAIVSVLDKMLRSKGLIKFIAAPFDRLPDRTLLKFVKGTERCVAFWTSLLVEPQWEKLARPKESLCAVADLGRGAHRRVLHACTRNGAICVLKFMLSENLSEALKETAVWRRAYPRFEVFAEVGSGRPGLKHKDVYWP